MKTVLLIGLGRFGRHLARHLNELGHEVMAVDHNEERVNAALNFVTSVQIGDSTKEEFLSSLGIKNFDLCFVTISNNFQSSLETTSLLKEMGAKMVISRAERDGQAKFLLRNGADEVVYPEKQLAKWASLKYTGEHILDFIELDDKYAVFEVTVPHEWVGKTIGEINIRKKYNINIMAIKVDDQMDISITADTLFTEDKTMVVLGEYKDLQKCFHIV